MDRDRRDFDDHIRRLDHRHRRHTRLQLQVLDCAMYRLIVSSLTPNRAAAWDTRKYVTRAA
jgi:hypothetical protein